MKIAIFGALSVLLVALGIFVLYREGANQSKEEIFRKELPMSQPETGEKVKTTLITVYDNYLSSEALEGEGRHRPELETDWGFSCLVRRGFGEDGIAKEENILFDTGADSRILFSNMKKLGVDPEEIDFVFISHLHGDHTGGLAGILELKPDLRVYKPESFSGPAQIEKGVWTTGPLGTWIKEQSLMLDTGKGIVVVTGCSHPGITNIIEKAREVFPEEKIHLVLGGFHLAESSDAELKEILEDFRNAGVEMAAPCHCSGDKCRELFEEEYGDDFVENGVGKIITIE